VIVPNVGHLPNVEDPLAFNDALLSFLGVEVPEAAPVADEAADSTGEAGADAPADAPADTPSDVATG
jgi:hypothetical protein